MKTYKVLDQSRSELELINFDSSRIVFRKYVSCAKCDLKNKQNIFYELKSVNC